MLGSSRKPATPAASPGSTAWCSAAEPIPVTGRQLTGPRGVYLRGVPVPGSAGRSKARATQLRRNTPGSWTRSPGRWPAGCLRGIQRRRGRALLAAAPLRSPTTYETGSDTPITRPHLLCQHIAAKLTVLPFWVYAASNRIPIDAGDCAIRASSLHRHSDWFVRSERRPSCQPSTRTVRRRSAAMATVPPPNHSTTEPPPFSPSSGQLRTLAASLPVPVSRLIGREQELADPARAHRPT